MSATPEPSVPPTSRQVWPDAAKAVCILLVVLWHTTSKYYEPLPWAVPGIAEAGWRTVNELLLPVRMPLFFLVSGYFAAVAIHRPWAAVLRRRVLGAYWLYAVWVLFAAGFFAVVPELRTYGAESVADLLVAAVLGYTSLWYLYALPVYFVLAKLGRRLPLGFVLGLATVLALAADLTTLPSRGNSDSLLANLVFFLLGALRPTVVDALATRARGRWVALALGAFLLAVGSAYLLGVHRAMGVSTLLGVAGAATGVLFFARASTVAPELSRRLAWLGRRTLPVYVLHLPLLAVLAVVTRAFSVQGRSPVTELLLALYPLAVVLIICTTALVLHGILVRAGLGWLFRLPDRRPRPGRPAQLASSHTTEGAGSARAANQVENSSADSAGLTR